MKLHDCALPDLGALALPVGVALSLRRRHAPVVLAHLVVGAVAVPLALLLHAAHLVVVGVAVEAARALAVGLVAARAAAGVLPADVGDGADVGAAAPSGGRVGDAGLLAAAVAVSRALLVLDADAALADALRRAVLDAAALGHAHAVHAGLVLQALAKAGAAS